MQWHFNHIVEVGSKRMESPKHLAFDEPEIPMWILGNGLTVVA